MHIHVPAGAIPKDGPSAGVAMFIAGLAPDRRTVRSDTAMTGEISLRGLVLPVGGIKEKVRGRARAPASSGSCCRRAIAAISRTSRRACASSSGVADRFADVISVDRARAFKPDPACYALVEPALGLPRREILFVSSNGFDVAGAKRYGLRVAWIERGAGAPPPQDSSVGPGEFYRLIRGRAEQLGQDPDYHVTRLTDLAPIVRSDEATHGR
jgi:beta-phosphoglucomutase-like phosphatase (HAD superfamily)